MIFPQQHVSFSYAHGTQHSLWQILGPALINIELLWQLKSIVSFVSLLKLQQQMTLLSFKLSSPEKLLILIFIFRLATFFKSSLCWLLRRSSKVFIAWRLAHPIFEFYFVLTWSWIAAVWIERGRSWPLLIWASRLFPKLFHLSAAAQWFHFIFDN